MEILLRLIIGHALCDYPLQGDFIGKFKSHKVASPIPGVTIWWHLLIAHSLIHCGSVWIITGSFAFAMAELIAHCAIDYAKSEGVTNFHQDQFLHIACKILYSIL